MNITSFISKLKEHMNDKDSKHNLFFSYLNIINEIYTYSSHLEKGNYEIITDTGEKINAFDKFLELQLDELKIRKKLNDGKIADIIGDSLDFLNKKRDPDTKIEESFKIEKFTPDILIKLAQHGIKDFSKSFDEDYNKTMGIFIDSLSKYNSITFIEDASEENIQNFEAAVTALNYTDKKHIYTEIVNMKDFTTREDELKLAQYADHVDYSENDKLRILGVDERTKAWIAFLTKIAKETVNENNMPGLIAEIKQNNPDAQSDEILDKISKMNGEDIKAIYSDAISLDLHYDYLNGIIERLMINNLDSLTNIIDRINSIDIEHLPGTIRDLIDNIDATTDIINPSLTLKAIKTMYKYIPDEYKKKIPLIKQYEAFKEKLVEDLKNSEIYKKGHKAVKDWLVEKIGVFALDNDLIAKNLGTPVSRSLTEYMLKSGKEIALINNRINEYSLDSAYGSQDQYDLGDDEEFKLRKLHELIINDLSDQDIKNDFKKLFTQLENKNSIDIEFITKLKTKIDKNSYFTDEIMKHVADELLISLTGATIKEIDSIDFIYKNNLFNEYIMAQVGKDYISLDKRNLYIDSFLGKNNGNIQLYFSDSPEEDYELKHQFIQSSLRSLLANNGNPKTKDKIEASINVLFLMDKIITLDEEINSADYVFAETDDFNIYLKTNFPNYNEIYNINSDDNHMLSEMKIIYNQKIDLLKYRFENKIYKNDIVVNRPVTRQYEKNIEKLLELYKNKELYLYSRYFDKLNEFKKEEIFTILNKHIFDDIDIYGNKGSITLYLENNEWEEKDDYQEMLYPNKEKFDLAILTSLFDGVESSTNKKEFYKDKSENFIRYLRMNNIDIDMYEVFNNQQANINFKIFLNNYLSSDVNLNKFISEHKEEAIASNFYKIAKHKRQKLISLSNTNNRFDIVHKLNLLSGQITDTIFKDKIKLYTIPIMGHQYRDTYLNKINSFLNSLNDPVKKEIESKAFDILIKKLENFNLIDIYQYHNKVYQSSTYYTNSDFDKAKNDLTVLSKEDIQILHKSEYAVEFLADDIRSFFIENQKDQEEYYPKNMLNLKRKLLSIIDEKLFDKINYIITEEIIPLKLHLGYSSLKMDEFIDSIDDTIDKFIESIDDIINESDNIDL